MRSRRRTRFTLHRELARARRAARGAGGVVARARAGPRRGLAFDTAVFTNLTRDHLDEHGDLAAYGRAKARLFERPELRARRAERATTRSPRELASGLPRGCEVMRTSTRGARRRAPRRASRVEPRRSRSRVARQVRPGRLVSPLVGEFNAENLLGALGALLARGSAAADCVRGARARPRGAGTSRGARRTAGDAVGRRRLCAHAGRARAARWPRSATSSRRAHGRVRLRRRSRSRQAAADGRRRCARAPQRVVLTDDNPRSEDPAGDRSRHRAPASARTARRRDRSRSARRDRERRSSARAPATSCSIAGKGHETEQLVGGERRPFNDRAVRCGAARERVVMTRTLAAVAREVAGTA